MTFFGEFARSPLGLIFLLLSLVNVYYGWRIARSAWQQRQALRREPLQPGHKRLLEQAAFFVAVPPGVLIHELFHALAVWIYGGRLVDAGYGFYFGYVAHVGVSAPRSLWVIAMAGTVGTLIYAVALWLWCRSRSASAYRFFGLRSFRVHILYALIFYPLFSAFTFIGDWRTVYDFGATPILSGATLAVHGAVLAAFWWADRRGYFEMPAFATADQQARLAQLEATAAASPHDTKAQLRLLEGYRQAGLERQAQRFARKILQRHPNSAAAHLQLALIQAQGQRQVPPKAAKNAQRALELGLNHDTAVAYAHHLAGQYALGLGKDEQALDHFSRGKEAARQAQQAPLEAQFSYQRALAQRRLGRYQAAWEDAQEAVRLAEAVGLEQAAAQYRGELETIRAHQ
ncbi:MAG: hypothetical protein R3300_18145 [Candidatus Promineifilaceae bacterium]|nr:hypothetical protein [Candidatus Promineifilaceae bacterium]